MTRTTIKTAMTSPLKQIAAENHERHLSFLLQRLLAVGGTSTRSAMEYKLMETWYGQDSRIPDYEHMKELLSRGFVSKKLLGGHWVWSITESGRSHVTENPA